MLWRVEMFSIQEKFLDDECPNPVYFNTPLLIVYLSAIKTLICHREIEFNRVFFLWFCTKTIT